MTTRNFQFMGAIMGVSTTVQFRTDVDIKDGAFSVFKEMGITPSTAMQLFLKQVQQTRTLPFIITANNDAFEEKEEGYDEWLRARLESTIKKLDSGEMKSYPHDEAMARLDARIAERRKLATASK
jgi:addiction module RelB/DinJ family antitoxin